MLALGFAVHAIVGGDLVGGRARPGRGRRAASGARSPTGCPLPPTPATAGNYAFVALVALILVLTTVRPFWRNVLLAPTLYLTTFVWDARLAFEPSITRLILIGVILIVLMNARPQGLLGETRVEIV